MRQVFALLEEINRQQFQELKFQANIHGQQIEEPKTKSAFSAAEDQKLTEATRERNKERLKQYYLGKQNG